MSSKPGWAMVACVLLVGLVVLAGAAEKTPSHVDLFTDPTSGWLEYEDDVRRYAYEEGVYVIKVSGEDQLAWSWAPKPIAPGDFVVETRFQQAGSGSGTCGLVWGEDDDHFVFIQISMTGWYAVDEFDDGQWVNLVPWTGVDPEFDPSIPNQLAIAKEGSSVTVCVDGKALSPRLTDPGFNECSVGLAVSTTDSLQMAVAFDDFSIGPLTASNAPLGTPLFADDFDDSASGWWTERSEDCVVRYDDGEYVVAILKPDLVAFGGPDALVETRLSDFRVDTAAYEASGVETCYGILWGTDSDNFYVFLVLVGRDPDGSYGIFQRRDGEWLPASDIDWTKSPAIHGAGELNRLRLVVQGDSVALIANGIELGLLQHSMRGPCDFFAVGGLSVTATPVVIRFTELTLWEL